MTELIIFPSSGSWTTPYWWSSIVEGWSSIVEGDFQPYSSYVEFLDALREEFGGEMIYHENRSVWKLAFETEDGAIRFSLKFL